MRKVEPKKPMSMVGPSKMEEKPIYPSFRIELQHLPEAKKWEIGKTYHVALDLKMSGISVSRYQNDAEFEIHGIGIDNEKEYSEEKE